MENPFLLSANVISLNIGKIFNKHLTPSRIGEGEVFTPKCICSLSSKITRELAVGFFYEIWGTVYIDYGSEKTLITLELI